MDPATPAVAVASVSTAGTAQVSAPICGLEPLVETLPAGAPVTIIIGWVARDIARAPAELIEFRKAIAS
jgi:hypothetical protein